MSIVLHGLGIGIDTGSTIVAFGLARDPALPLPAAPEFQVRRIRGRTAQEKALDASRLRAAGWQTSHGHALLKV